MINKKRCFYGLLLLSVPTVLLLGLTACGGGEESKDLLSIAGRSATFECNGNVPLPKEMLLEGTLGQQEDDFRLLEGNWEKSMFRWHLTAEKFPYLKNGLAEVSIPFMPPKRFRFSFSFRHRGVQGYIAEVYHNRIRIVVQKGSSKKKLVEYPVSFNSNSNRLQILFFNDLLIMNFNTKELGRLRSKGIMHAGYLDNFSVAAGENVGRFMAIRYLTYDKKEKKKDDSSNYAKVFNWPLDTEATPALKPYLRYVRIGNSIMPSIFAPPRSRLAIPVELPRKGGDLRFSIATLPIYHLSKTSVKFKVAFKDDNKEDEIAIFEKTLAPVQFFDESWVGCKVDLSQSAGKSGEIIFYTEADLKDAADEQSIIPVWGAPRILPRVMESDSRRVVLITIENFGIDSIIESKNAIPAPSVANFVRDSVIFPNVYPSDVWQPASLWSILNGRSAWKNYYFYEKAGDTGNSPPFPMSKYLRIAECDTAAFYQGIHALPIFNLYQGFNEYFSNSLNVSAGSTRAKIENPYKLVSKAILWLERRKDSNFFVHLHFANLSKRSLAGLQATKLASRGTMKRRYERDYLKELKNIDGSVGRVLNSLWKMGLLSSTVVIISGLDGKEPFMGAGNELIDKKLKDDFLRVPVIIHVPSKFRFSGERHRVLSLVDIYPTVLDFLDLDVQDEIEGESFSDFVKGGEGTSTPDEKVVSTSLFNPVTGYPIFAFRLDQDKIHYMLQGNKPVSRHYNLAVDADEMHPLVEHADNDLPAALTEMIEMVSKIDGNIYKPQYNAWVGFYLSLLTGLQITK